LRHFAELYEIEREARQLKLDADARDLNGLATGDPAISSDLKVTIFDSALAWTIADLQQLTNWARHRIRATRAARACLFRNATR
jgi:hypothetical protein